jgi:NLR family CARD domain-containing protein 3
MFRITEWVSWLGPSFPPCCSCIRVGGGLAQVSLAGKDTGDKEAKQIARVLATNTAVDTLRLCGNHIGNDGAVALASFLSTTKSLRGLWLHGNDIGDVGTTALARSLQRNDSLSWLDLGSNKIGTVGLTALADALKLNKGLHFLDLVENSINDDAAVAMGEGLKCNAALIHLYFSHGIFTHSDVGDEGAAALGGALKVNSTLERLYLNGRFIRDEGAMSILDALECNTTLTSIYLSWSTQNISQTINSAIDDLVYANEAGIRLLHAGSDVDLSFKHIEAEAAKVVAKDLARNTVVTTLNLKNNNAGGGAIDIGVALAKSRTLMSIELDHNGIGDSGLVAIADALLENNVLTKLSLNGNRVGPAGAVALARCLRQNSCLQRLGLGQSSLADDGAAAIADALKSNTSLTELDLNGNKISDVGAMAILRALQEGKCTLTLLNLDKNADISPRILSAIDFVLSSGVVLSSLLRGLGRPPDKRLIPLAIQAVNRSVHRKKVASWVLADRLVWTTRKLQELPRGHEVAASPVFFLVREAALRDSEDFEWTSNTKLPASPPEFLYAALFQWLAAVLAG